VSSDLFLPGQSDYKGHVLGLGRPRTDTGGTVRLPWHSAVSPAVAIYEQPRTGSDLPEAAPISIAGKAEPA